MKRFQSDYQFDNTVLSAHNIPFGSYLEKVKTQMINDLGNGLFKMGFIEFDIRNNDDKHEIFIKPLYILKEEHVRELYNLLRENNLIDEFNKINELWKE